MPNLLLYFAHPGQQYSHANAAMIAEARRVEGPTFVDLYAEYPRFDIDPDKEQQRLLDHDIVLFQFPLFWYSTPSIIKEWEDIVLEHGFAYGHEGDRLAGKRFGLAITAAGPEDAYTPDGYQRYPLRDFLRPLEQTANLCKMRFLPPYVLYGSLMAPGAGAVAPHAHGYRRYLEALQDGDFDAHETGPQEVWTAADMQIKAEA